MGRLFALRTLHLYRGAVAHTHWFRRGAEPPLPPPPAGLTARWSLDAAAAGPLPQPAGVLARRFADGARVFTIRREADGALLYQLWMCAKGAWIDWIQAWVVPLPQHMLVYDVWSHEDYRDGRLHYIGAAQAVGQLHTLGAEGMCAGVEAHEVLPFARMYARSGVGFIEPYARLVHWRFAGLGVHFTRGAPPRLVGACRRLQARYGAGPGEPAA